MHSFTLRRRLLRRLLRAGVFTAFSVALTVCIAVEVVGIAEAVGSVADGGVSSERDVACGVWLVDVVVVSVGLEASLAGSHSHCAIPEIAEKRSRR